MRRIQNNHINGLQILIGVAGLSLGALVYLIDRPPEATYFIYFSRINISLYNILPNVFGVIGNSLPDFLHVFSFILITAGLLSCQKKCSIIVCISWFSLDFLFVKGDVGSKTTSRTSKQIFFWKWSREGLYHLLIKGSILLNLVKLKVGRP